VGLPACPLMHATGLGIGALPALVMGGEVVLLQPRGFDPDDLWATAERERANAITIVGDAFGRPMLRALQARPDRDLASLRIICSSGAMFSAETRVGLLELLPQTVILDFVAATEGVMGTALSTRDAPVDTGRFQPGPGVRVLGADDRPVTPGSGDAGVVAVPGQTPVGYFKDESKSAATFRVIDGVRYSLPGDWATVEADGSIAVLGRGSQCINTGGEKVFPEEVEEALKRHGPVEDCLVFGVPDERFGQRIVAVASLAPGRAASTEELLGNARRHLASFKVPRSLHLVDRVPRAANGKADYARARELFEAAVVDL
jgi:fatty-acyl-CoA synthase